MVERVACLLGGLERWSVALPGAKVLRGMQHTLRAQTPAERRERKDGSATTAP